MTIVHI